MKFAQFGVKGVQIEVNMGLCAAAVGIAIKRGWLFCSRNINRSKQIISRLIWYRCVDVSSHIAETPPIASKVLLVDDSVLLQRQVIDGLSTSGSLGALRAFLLFFRYEELFFWLAKRFARVTGWGRRGFKFSDAIALIGVNDFRIKCYDSDCNSLLIQLTHGTVLGILAFSCLGRSKSFDDGWDHIIAKTGGHVH